MVVEKIIERRLKVKKTLEASAKNDIAKYGEYNTLQEAWSKYDSVGNMMLSIYKASEEYGGKYVLCEDLYPCGMAPLGFSYINEDGSAIAPPDEEEARFGGYK